MKQLQQLGHESYRQFNVKTEQSTFPQTDRKENCMHSESLDEEIRTRDEHQPWYGSTNTVPKVLVEEIETAPHSYGYEHKSKTLKIDSINKGDN